VKPSCFSNFAPQRRESGRNRWNKADDMFDETVDAVVVGSGAAGLTAALVAKSAGLDVVVLEKTDRIGGNTAMSGGAVWIPDNPHLAEAGHSDSRDAVMTYLHAMIGNRLQRDLVDAFLDAGPKAVAFLDRSFHLERVGSRDGARL